VSDDYTPTLTIDDRMREQAEKIAVRISDVNHSEVIFAGPREAVEHTIDGVIRRTRAEDTASEFIVQPQQWEIDYVIVTVKATA
jgi:hypothetical protein